MGRWFMNDAWRMVGLGKVAGAGGLSAKTSTLSWFLACDGCGVAKIMLGEYGWGALLISGECQGPFQSKWQSKSPKMQEGRVYLRMGLR